MTSGREYIFVHQIDKRTPLDTHIPLHMTALHWFEAEVEPGEMIRMTQFFAKKQESLSTRASKEDLFGQNKDIPVMRLERTAELLDLHIALLGLVRSCGARLDEQWVGESNWNPHVTHQPEARLYAGDEVMVDSLDLITRRHDGVLEMLARVGLGGGGV